MKVHELADWALGKGCNYMKNCDHPACREIEEAVRFLHRLQRFEGTDEAGRSVRGYIIEDQQEQ